MYNIKGPSKIVTKTTTRRGKQLMLYLERMIYIFVGISQTIDNYRDHNKNKIIENDQYDSTK